MYQPRLYNFSILCIGYFLETLNLSIYPMHFYHLIQYFPL